MDKPFFQNLREALQDENQSNAEFFVDQMARGYGALKEAHKIAKRNEQGKAVFYYKYNGQGEEDGTILIDLEYIDARTNQFKSLNYIAAIITGGGVGLKTPKKVSLSTRWNFQTVQQSSHNFQSKLIWSSKTQH